jgi:SAM-dependent methyltransferase
VIKVNTLCAICGFDTPSKVIIEESIPNGVIGFDTFSARRTPDKITFRWLKCNFCNLVRSYQTSPINLDNLYVNSFFNYSDLVPNLIKTYSKIIKRYIKNTNSNILEIGGGNGFMIHELFKNGYNKLLEIEPSIDAYNSSHDDIKKFFIRDMFNGSIPIENKFDFIMTFHVFDHVPNPLEFLSHCRKFLKDGAPVVIAVHNQKSFSEKILKDKSPIYDVEHTYLYSKKTLAHILKLAGFSNIKVKTYWNWVTIDYLIHLMPIPSKLKAFMNSMKIKRYYQKISLYLPLGNIYAVATN